MIALEPAALAALPKAKLRELAKLTTPRLNRYIPHRPHPKQQAFLLLGHSEGFYGGSGGGGKSAALLMAALQYADVPGYSALLLRKTFAQLVKGSALIPLSQEWLTQSDASFNGETKAWTFPSGARLEFGYLASDSDRFNYASAEYQFIGFDEVTDFTEASYRFLFSRLRRREGMGVPLRVRSASNPIGPGFEWVKHRFVDPGAPDRPFIRAKLSDNPSLDQDGYRQSLSHLDPITRAQIENGDWTARHGGSIFRREWFEIVDELPAQASLVRYWDLAASTPVEGEDPDWTVGCLMARSREGVFYIADVARARLRPQPRDALIRQTAMLDGKHVPVLFEQEPGASGVSQTHYFVTSLLPGWQVAGERPTGEKIVRAAPLSSQAEAGNVKLLRGAWNAVFLDELEAFPVSCAHDDQVDAASGAFARLAQGRMPGDYGLTL